MSTRRGHPFLFMLTFGTCVTALLAGDVVVAFLMAWAAWWLLTTDNLVLLCRPCHRRADAEQQAKGGDANEYQSIEQDHPRGLHRNDAQHAC